MKAYVAMCSLSLAAGAALGHFNGKYAAASHFIDSCDSVKIVAFQDREADTRRDFHCFEIESREHRKIPAKEQRAPVRMI